MKHITVNIYQWITHHIKSETFREYISFGITVLLLLSLFSSIIMPVVSAERPTDKIDTNPAKTSSPSTETTNPSINQNSYSDNNDDGGGDGAADGDRVDTGNGDVKPDDDGGDEDEDAADVVGGAANAAGNGDVKPGDGNDGDDDQPKSSSFSNHSTIAKNKPSNNSKKSISEFIFEEKNDTTDDNTVKEYSTNIRNISTNQTVSVKTNKTTQTQKSSTQKKTTIEKVEFKAASSQKNVDLSVKNLKEKPPEVKINITVSEDSEIYEYLDIKLTADDQYIGETGIQTMNFTFTVTRSWIENRSIDKHTVKMMRYHNDTWQTLNTTYVNETDDEIRFKADTPGLSVFAVVGNKVVEDSDEIVVESSHMPWWMPASVIFVSTVALGVVLVKKRFVYNP